MQFYKSALCRLLNWWQKCCRLLLPRRYAVFWRWVWEVCGGSGDSLGFPGCPRVMRSVWCLGYSLSRALSALDRVTLSGVTEIRWTVLHKIRFQALKCWLSLSFFYPAFSFSLYVGNPMMVGGSWYIKCCEIQLSHHFIKHLINITCGPRQELIHLISIKWWAKQRKILYANI